MRQLCITVQWLDDRYHGLLDRDGPPEWPPSPFRLFQALLAGVARLRQLDSKLGKSLAWLESLPEPLIVAPRSCAGQVVTRFVPNNDGDEVPDRQGRLTGKTARPTILLDRPAIHYLWAVGDNVPEAQDVVQVSRTLSCFGWGIDMAYGDGQLLDEQQVRRLQGIRWFPKPGILREDGVLRVPTRGSMKNLLEVHRSFLGRIEQGKPLQPVDKPSIYNRVFYASVERPAGRPYVAFALRTTTDDTYRYPHAKLIHIAGMTRRASIKAMKYPPGGVREPEAWIDSFVAGHQTAGEHEHQQFSYIPLPSIGHDHADAMIRRVMIVAPFGRDKFLGHLADQLDGVQLEPEGGGQGPVLDYVRSDGVVRRYLGPSRAWASVTPVILPGHDDHKPAKTVKLIEKLLLQSGIEQACQFTWSALPNFKNCLAAYTGNARIATYFRPDHLKGLTSVHIRITFDNPVPGPLSIGAGRHCGLGMLASINEL